MFPPPLTSPIPRRFRIRLRKYSPHLKESILPCENMVYPARSWRGDIPETTNWRTWRRAASCQRGNFRYSAVWGAECERGFHRPWGEGHPSPIEESSVNPNGYIWGIRCVKTYGVQAVFFSSRGGVNIYFCLYGRK